MSALRPAFFILYLESCISRLNVIPCHDLTLSVGEPDNAAAKLRSEQTVTPLHEQSPATYFLRLNNLETFVELVGARPLHLLSQTVLPLKSPTGAFIAPLRCANAVPPQTLLRTDEEELCQFDIIPPTTERNRAFPTGNALLYILLSYVDFSGCVRRDAPYFCFIMVGCTSKRIYRFFFSLAASWLVLRCSTIWANHSTIAGSS